MILKPIEPKKDEILDKTPDKNSDKDINIPAKSARSKSSDSFLNDLNDMSSKKS